jgi:hypothetical protein
MARIWQFLRPCDGQIRQLLQALAQAGFLPDSFF